MAALERPNLSSVTWLSGIKTDRSSDNGSRAESGKAEVRFMVVV